MKLSDLKIIVTGGAQGMGAHFARRLAEAGAQVAVGDVQETGLAALAENTQGLAGQVHTRRLDVASETDVAEFVAWARQAMGGLNGLINNAGILRDGLLVKKDRTTGQVARLSREQWQQVIDVNLTGATFMVRDPARFLMEENYGEPLTALFGGDLWRECETAPNRPECLMLKFREVIRERGIAKHALPFCVYEDERRTVLYYLVHLTNSDLGMREMKEAMVKKSGDMTFWPVTVRDPAQHHHVPLLLSPFGYSTYRGS